jgi:hypothetical protein
MKLVKIILAAFASPSGMPTFGETGHLNLQGYGIFPVAHVGIDAQMGDGQLGGFERESHLIAGLGIILEDEVYDASSGIK